MKRDLAVYLEDILESIKLIEKYTNSLSYEQFENNIPIQDAVIRRFEIIGEAVKHIPSDFKKDHPEIEWKEAAGTRDVFIHEYFEVILERVWGTIKDDLPKLKKQIEKLIEKTDE